MARIKTVPPEPPKPVYVAELNEREMVLISKALRMFKYENNKAKPLVPFDEIEQLEVAFLTRS